MGRQRLAEHEEASAELEKEMILEQINHLDPEQTVFGDMFENDDHYSTLPKLRAEFAQNMEQMKRIQLLKVG